MLKALNTNSMRDILAIVIALVAMAPSVYAINYIGCNDNISSYIAAGDDQLPDILDLPGRDCPPPTDPDFEHVSSLKKFPWWILIPQLPPYIPF